MAELRWNPLLRTYTMVANNRQNRPNMPKDYCPFCIGSGKVPDEYSVLLYPNDFPALSTPPPIPEMKGNDSFYHHIASHGKCEVILYSPNHTANLYDLSQAHIIELIELWIQRCKVHSQDPLVNYVFPFENRGAAVGVTMPHPHGQLYAYPFIPLKIKTELDSAKEYYETVGKNLFEDMNTAEKEFGQRLVYENESFLAYIPYFTDYPYGVFIVAKKEISNLIYFDVKTMADLADILKTVTGGFDALFDDIFPYMMCVHQSPFNSEEYKNADKYYRFHIEFYTPWRSHNLIKYYASSEMGAWAAANTRAVEDTAQELKMAIAKFLRQ